MWRNKGNLDVQINTKNSKDPKNSKWDSMAVKWNKTTVVAFKFITIKKRKLTGAYLMVLMYAMHCNIERHT